MLRLYRKTIFRRWHVHRKTSSEKRNIKQPAKSFVLCTASQKQNHSNQNDEKKQHADKQDKQYWDDPQFQFNFFRASILETAGWLGTAALYFSYHLKKINNVFEYDRINSSCIFSNIVLAMPRRSSGVENSVSRPLNSPSQSSNINNQIEKKITYDILGNIKNLADQYSSAVQNSTGTRLINKNDKKAFRYFQSAARLGSSQGLYNLGLCYHLGKGTKVNLNMAAFCYRKAAMKGHGLASFNLAIFFYKGMGGLPVDPKLAKDLLAEAAEKGVPEAQLYFGIEFLEEKRWLEAVQIFINLAEKNVSDAQYYLGICYENGLGINKDEKVAFELFTKSAAHGNKKAIDKLQEKERSIKSSVVKNKERSLHVSSSVPELTAVIQKPVQSTTTITISSYLDLITPFLMVKKDDTKSKDNFFVGENSVVKECSSTFLHFRSIPLVMQFKAA